ncbi:hypothetical protein HII13_005122 [Brettanomyces bruxellensis]|nr:hypothetical protein HII13_005122 [Brettanomyces bruxellensis]
MVEMDAKELTKAGQTDKKIVGTSEIKEENTSTSHNINDEKAKQDITTDKYESEEVHANKFIEDGSNDNAEKTGGQTADNIEKYNVIGPEKDNTSDGNATKTNDESKINNSNEGVEESAEVGQAKIISSETNKDKENPKEAEVVSDEIIKDSDKVEKKNQEGEVQLKDKKENSSTEPTETNDKLENKTAGGALFSINDKKPKYQRKKQIKKRPSLAEEDEGPEHKKLNTGSIEKDEKDEGKKLPPEDKDDPALKKQEAPMHQLPEITREDKTLEEVLEMMDDEDFTPIIPDAVTDYYLAKSGFSTSNRKIKRLLALATQKFISDIATDAYEYSRIRSNSAVYNSANPQVRARALMTATVMNIQGSNPSEKSDGENGNAENATSSLTNGPGQQAQNQKVTLTMEDLSSAFG